MREEPRAPAPEAPRVADRARNVSVQGSVEVQVPLERLYDEAARGYERGGVVGAIWRSRTWYPYLLLPFWIVALFLCGIGPRSARAAGVLIFVLTAAILALEFAYVGKDFGGILPADLRPVEVVVAWVVVIAILVWRRHGRSLFDAEAGVSAQALLCALHGFTFIGNDVRVWIVQGASLGPMVRAVFANYLPAFWVAEAALFVAAAPAYLPLFARTARGGVPRRPGSHENLRDGRGSAATESAAPSFASAWRTSASALTPAGVATAVVTRPAARPSSVSASSRAGTALPSIDSRQRRVGGCPRWSDMITGSCPG